MSQTIGQRELRNDNAEIMRRVERGESFTVTRNGRPIADLVPHQADREPAGRQLTAGDLIGLLNTLPPVDADQWYRERAEDDGVFGPDDPLEDPWDRERNAR